MPDWSAWKAVPGGGKTFSAPSAAVRGDTLHLFVRGTDDGVHRKRFNGEWDPWTQVPGDEKTPSGPTSVGLGKYQLTVFIRRSDNTIHANTESGSTSWSGWVEVDGGVEGGRTPSEPTVGLWSPTGPIAINLIVRGMDNGVHISTLGSGWSPWREIPGGGKTPSAPAMASTNADLLNVVVRGTDDGLHFKQCNGSSWSAWNLIPGGGKTRSAPALIEFDGDLHLFVRGYDDGIHLKKFNGSSWSAWTEVPGGGKTPSAPAVVKYDGDLYLFVRGIDDNVHYKILD